MIYISLEKKYICRGGIFNPNIIDKWLPRWYGVSFEDCIFSSEQDDTSGTLEEWEMIAQKSGTMLLTDLPKGTNYKQHLKILKTERLIYGNDIR